MYEYVNVKIPSRYRHNEKNFTYSNRVGPSGGTFPATNGDIFVHGKSNDLSKLYDLAKEIRHRLPAGAIGRFNDDYAFKYRSNRDLAGFVDGTENPSGESPREHVAINNVNGSFCVKMLEALKLLKVIQNQPRISPESV